jgi:hypothetical protein
MSASITASMKWSLTLWRATRGTLASSIAVPCPARRPDRNAGREAPYSGRRGGDGGRAQAKACPEAQRSQAHQGEAQGRGIGNLTVTSREGPPCSRPVGGFSRPGGHHLAAPSPKPLSGRFWAEPGVGAEDWRKYQVFQLHMADDISAMAKSLPRVGVAWPSYA